MPSKKNKKKIGSPLKPKRKLALGRGLDALIPGIESIDDVDYGSNEYFHCDINLIVPNRFQPRVKFAEDELNDLCRSIKEQGIIQPLLVRKDENGYELVSGERRLRASKMAGLSKVPVVIKDISDVKMLEISIVENIQRENLNPIEEAEAYQRLITEFDLKQDQVADRVGKSRSAVANFLRLRRLPAQIKDSMTNGSLSMGHARALLGAKNAAQQSHAWRTILSKNLSVRQTETLIKRLGVEKRENREKEANSDDMYFDNLADDLSRQFGTRVRILRRGKKGKVEIEFFSNNDLDRVIGILKQQ
jgi:ParB family chromosome partitioning protein